MARRYAARWLVRLSASMVLTCSREAASVAPRDRQGRKATVVNYGLRLPVYSRESRAEMRRVLGISSDAPVFIHVGRFYPQKNHMGMMEIFREIVRDMPLARLLLAGDGPLRAEIQQLASKLDISDQVQFLGNRNDVPALLSAADVFLFPSLHEGLALVGLEAAAAGLPVVASPLECTYEAFEEWKEGKWFVPPTDAKEFAAAAVKAMRGGRMSPPPDWLRYWSIRQGAERLRKIYRTIQGA